MLTVDQAFLKAQRQVNERCRLAGVDGLSGKDIAIIAAYGAFERGYRRVAASLHPDDESRFDRDAVAFGVKCIATAILA